MVRAGVVAVLAGMSAPLAASPSAAADGIASGVYGEMIVARDPVSHRISGYFSSSTGEGKFSCIFYFSGTPSGTGIPIRSYFPDTPRDVIAGRIEPGAPAGFRLRLDTEHGGCWNVRHFADRAEPARFTLDSRHPWVAVAVVKSARAHFFDRPAAAAPRKTYVVRGDGVGVRARQPGWLLVDFVGGGRPASGWIRAADVYPAD